MTEISKPKTDYVIQKEINARNEMIRQFDSEGNVYILQFTSTDGQFIRTKIILELLCEQLDLNNCSDSQIKEVIQFLKDMQ